jgi:hypothetical protein
MKFDCGETWQEKEARLGKWHRWFAWRPVYLGPHDCRWLEFIWRRGDRCASWYETWWNWQYNDVQPKGSDE